MKLLEHCNRWFRVDAIYKARGDRGYDVTYLYAAGCPHCAKRVIGYSDFDSMGVNRTPGGAAIAHKRTHESFSRLIESGMAVLVDRPSADHRPTIGSVEGVGDYTRKVAKDWNRLYVMKIDRTTRKYGVNDLLARGHHGKIATAGGFTGRS